METVIDSPARSGTEKFVSITVDTGNDPISIDEFISFFNNLRSLYGKLIDNPAYAERLLLRENLLREKVDLYGLSGPNDLPLEILRISRNSPLKSDLKGTLRILVLAVILSGGTLKYREVVEVSLPPLSETIVKMEKAIGQVSHDINNSDRPPRPRLR